VVAATPRCVLRGLLRNFESFLPDEARIMRVSNFCVKSLCFLL